MYFSPSLQRQQPRRGRAHKHHSSGRGDHIHHTPLLRADLGPAPRSAAASRDGGGPTLKSEQTAAAGVALAHSTTHTSMPRPERRQRLSARRPLPHPTRSYQPPAAGEGEGAGGDHGALQRLELPPQELWARLPRLPGLWKLAWTDQEVWADVLQAVFPQQCQGHWLHQVPLIHLVLVP